MRLIWEALTTCLTCLTPPVLIRPRLLYAPFVVSRIRLPKYSPLLKKVCVRQAALDEWLTLKDAKERRWDGERGGGGDAPARAASAGSNAASITNEIGTPNPN